MDRRALRRIFLSAFRSEGLEYANGGCQVVHPELTWSISLVVDGPGASAPYRLFLGASLTRPGEPAPRDAEQCALMWPLPYAGTEGAGPVLRMPDAAFPEWTGADRDRAEAIAESVTAVAGYARRVGSLHELRVRYSAGDFDGALIMAPLRRVLRARP